MCGASPELESLLAVGYSTCHWCHVMEEESFQNKEIGAIMNENFVCIKVDREERPDVDKVYMTFVQVGEARAGSALLSSRLIVLLQKDQRGVGSTSRGVFAHPDASFRLPAVEAGGR